MKMRRCKAFTLAELLIALAILGVIATFTIPKVLTAQTDAKYNAIAKEAAGMISGAYQSAQLDGVINEDSSPWDFTPYMNYVKLETNTPIDDWQTGDDWGCTNAVPCIRLHSGAMLQIGGASFDGTGTLNCVSMQLDPDGKYSNSTDGPGKAVNFILYYNGVLRTKGTIYPGSISSSGTDNPDETYDPPWFSWN